MVQKDAGYLVSGTLAGALRERRQPRSPNREVFHPLDKNGNLDEKEQERLESRLRLRGWAYAGYTPSGISGVAGVHRAERAGTRVVSQSSTTTRGLLDAIEAFERDERSSKGGDEHVTCVTRVTVVT
jgi:hypothetical protein